MPADQGADGSGAHATARLSGSVLIVVIIALGALVIAALAWSRPTRVASVVHYHQAGHLTYGAAVDGDTVYGPTGLQTGQPVYTHVVPALDLSYTYRLSGPSSVDMSGTEQLVATVSNGQGVTRTLPLQPVTKFSGHGFRTSVQLPIPQLQLAAASFAQVPGAGQPSADYPVTLTPSVKAHGRLDGAPVSLTFDEPVSFVLQPSVLVPVASHSNLTPLAAPSTATGASAPRFNPSATGSTVVAAGREATLFLGLPVGQLRIASLIVLALAVAAGLLLAQPLVRDAASDDERVRIALRHGSSLIEAAHFPTEPGVAVVSLRSFEGLSQVARQLECPVLHVHDGLGDVYGVVDNGTLYRYRIPSTVRLAALPTNGNGSVTPSHAEPAIELR